ncbi:MAG: hypothetical protein H0T76_15140 [Nannocystis sp.]|nr:hypothetical protein [Nannocystis sp.]MBA3547816.1 hypothetical protein [Nannocystis sp.]
MFVATTLVLSLALSPVTPLGLGSVVPQAHAWMAVAPDPACPKLEPRVVLQIDTQALGAGGEGVANRLRVAAEREIQGFDLMLGPPTAQELPVVVIKVVPLPGEDEGFSYTIDINHAAEKPIKDGSSVGECKLCIESEVLEKVAGSTRALLPKLRAHITDFNNRPCKPEIRCKSDADCNGSAEGPRCNLETGVCFRPKPECETDADCVGNAHGPTCHKVIKACVKGKDGGQPPPPPPPGMNTKQKAGIGLMVAGAVGVGAGIGLVARKPSPTGTYEAWSTLETQKPGYAVLAVGGAALVTGVVLFVLGRRDRSRSQVTPVASMNSWSLVWTGRF